MGKLTKYQPHVEPKLETIEAWYRNGADDKIVAGNLNVGYSTYLKYKQENPELMKVTIVGKEPADLKVESSLYNNAIGYYYTEEVAFKCKNISFDENGKRVEKEEVVVAEVRRYAKPETIAQFFWLKNRKPKEWKDKQDIEINGELQASTGKLQEILDEIKGL